MADSNVRRLDKLVRKAGLVLGSLETPGKAVERATDAKVKAIMNLNPLYNTFKVQESSSGSGRLFSLRCQTERFRNSVVPLYL